MPMVWEYADMVAFKSSTHGKTNTLVALLDA